MNKTITLLLLLHFVVFAYGQKFSVTGVVKDTASQTLLTNAVISILLPDSVLYSYSRSQLGGTFIVKDLPAGKYILLISYPNYADYVDDIEIKTKDLNLGSIALITKTHLLEEVIVKQKIAAIRIKGDTTEFKADSFHTDPNANVQDLLKRLPGIQVNSKGEITAQGQKVEKVLVDGEEFFSDDPAVVTQTLRADVVDKVQVYDKKSDQAVFSGIDDGQKQKTINLQLKEDKKKGYFGKLEAGSNADQYRYGKAMINSFKAKRKLAAFVTNDNTKFQSLNWSERSNYSNDLNRNTTVQDDGSVWISSSGDDFNWGQGLPTSTTAGLFYSNKWDNDKQNIGNTYQYNKLDVLGTTNTITQTILPDTTFITSQKQNSNSQRERHRLNSTYEWQIDSTSSVKTSVTGAMLSTKGVNNFNSQSINQDNVLLNQADRTTSVDNNEKDFFSTIFWRKRFQKKGRTISFTGEWNTTGMNNNGFLQAHNSFYDNNGNIASTQLIDQSKKSTQQLSSGSGRLVYTEPIWKNTFVELNYRIGLTHNDAANYTYNNTGNNNYNELVDSLSNHFIYNVVSQSGGFNFRWNEKKYNISLGSNIGTSVFHLDDRIKNNAKEISFTNFLPSANIVLLPKKQTRINLMYNGTTQNPTMQQIQPFIDNTDPLNIVIGNPNLKQEFRHNFTLNASDFKIMKNKRFWMSSNLTIINNAITTSSTVDNVGRRVNQAINVNGNYNGNMWASYGFDIKSPLSLNIGLSPSISRYINFVNGAENVNNNIGLGSSIGVSKWNEKPVNFYVYFEPTYNRSVSSIRSDVITHYWSFQSQGSLMAKLPGKFYVEVNDNITIFEKTSVFTANSDIYLINASVKKTFSKNENWEIKLSVNDLLNQNQGITRNVTSNFISQTQQQTIQRYFMFSVTYNFSKNGKPSN
ncbi:MAG: TonB-dependent receptor [Bacteroidota bacterium]|nr:TonB-dependent receptor [Bacteroidota bacterium]